MARTSDRLFIAKGDRPLYDKLVEQSILVNKTRREQFLLAMAIGFKHGLCREFDQRDEFFFLKDLRPEDEAVMDAVALEHSKGDMDVLADREKVLQIAQQYAHGGIRLLSDEYQASSYGTFEKEFERQLLETWKAGQEGAVTKKE